MKIEKCQDTDSLKIYYNNEIYTVFKEELRYHRWDPTWDIIYKFRMFDDNDFIEGIRRREDIINDWIRPRRETIKPEYLLDEELIESLKIMKFNNDFIKQLRKMKEDFNNKFR